MAMIVAVALKMITGICVFLFLKEANPETESLLGESLLED